MARVGGNCGDHGQVSLETGVSRTRIRGKMRRMTSTSAITHVWDDRSAVTAAPTRRCPVCGGKYPSEFVVCPKDATVLETATTDGDPLVGEVLAGSFCV